MNPADEKRCLYPLRESEEPMILSSMAGYRRITFCYIDSKIFTKILTWRLQTAIYDVVGNNQTCSIKGWSIQTSIHVARSILKTCTDNQRPVAVLQIDLTEEFDKVQHSFLLAILSRIGIGSVILEGVRMAYKRCSTKLVINRSVSVNILVESCVRHGCLLSPLLFALYLEPFCRSTINSSYVRGFSLNATEVKVIVYTDDIAVFSVNKKVYLRPSRWRKRFAKYRGHKCTRKSAAASSMARGRTLPLSLRAFTGACCSASISVRP